MKTVRSFCRICTSVCGILVDVEGDQRRARARRPGPPAVARLHLPRRVARSRQMHHHPDRLERPHAAGRRRAPPTTRGRRASTTSATALAHDHRRARSRRGRRVLRQRHRHGRRRLPHGAGAARRIGTPAKFSPLTIDGTAKTLVSDLVGGALGFSGRPDYDRADARDVHRHQPGRVARPLGRDPRSGHRHPRARAAAAEVWVIDPRRTETARLATRHLAPRPATDYAVLAFLVRELLRDGADRVLASAHGRSRRARRGGRAVHARAHGASADVAGGRSRASCSPRSAGRSGGVDTGTGVTMAAAAPTSPSGWPGC